MSIKKISVALITLSLMNLTGCATTSNVLTHVPQEPLLRAQFHHAPQKKRVVTKVSPEKLRAQFLGSQPIEIQKAFLQYQDTGKAPIIQASDFIQFPYSDSSQPIVVCQTLNTCEIQLEQGEIITGLQAGDTVRWIFSESYSGEGESRQPHVIVKPKFSDTSTNLIVTTTKRTYHIGLMSKDNNGVKQAKFYYPDEMMQQLKAFNSQMVARLRAREQTEIVSVPTIDPAQLDDHYAINTMGCCFISNPAWKPLRAFNDGTHVYIEMPAQLRVTDAPVLFIQTKDNRKALVNYRVRKNYYIVDELFKKAVMVSGVGNSQEKVVITYVG